MSWLQQAASQGQSAAGSRVRPAIVGQYLGCFEAESFAIAESFVLHLGTGQSFFHQTHPQVGSGDLRLAFGFGAAVDCVRSCFSVELDRVVQLGRVDTSAAKAGRETSQSGSDHKESHLLFLVDGFAQHNCRFQSS